MNNKYFYGTFNLNFSLQNKKLQLITFTSKKELAWNVSVAENAEKKISIKLLKRINVEVAYFEEKSLNWKFHRTIYYSITFEVSYFEEKSLN